MATLKAVDLSRWQGAPDFALMRGAGIQAVYIQALYGESLRDPDAAHDFDGAAAAGMRRGWYHFATPGQPITADASAQAEAFLAAMHELGGFGELPPALDLEVAPAGMSGVELVRWALRWFDEVDAGTGATSPATGAILYSYPAFIRQLGPAVQLLGSRRLWLASYAAKPALPAGPWATLFGWQKSDTGRVPGIEGDVDVDEIYLPDATKSDAPAKWSLTLDGQPVRAHVDLAGGEYLVQIGPLAAALHLSVEIDHQTKTLGLRRVK